MESMARDMRHPYIPSTTVLGDQQLIGCYVGNDFFFSLRLFVVGGERIAMAMVVVGNICTPTIMVVHNIIY